MIYKAVKWKLDGHFSDKSEIQDIQLTKTSAQCQNPAPQMVISSSQNAAQAFRPPLLLKKY